MAKTAINDLGDYHVYLGNLELDVPIVIQFPIPRAGYGKKLTLAASVAQTLADVDLTFELCDQDLHSGQVVGLLTVDFGNTLGKGYVIEFDRPATTGNLDNMAANEADTGDGVADTESDSLFVINSDEVGASGFCTAILTIGRA